MPRFFSRLNYTFGNEDWNTERDALQVNAGDRVICVTASGDRPLHLLLTDCAEVVSVDANEQQNHLLALKMAALEQFNFNEYISFLGGKECGNRKHNFSSLAQHMAPSAAQYWVGKEKSIERGVLYQGSVEKFVSKLANVLRLVRGGVIDQLFEFDDLEKQREFVQKHWNTFLWKQCFYWILHPYNPFISRFVVNDPGLYAQTSFHPGNYLCQRIHDCLMRCLARDSSLFSLIFRGKVESAAFPPYLTEEGVNKIKPKIKNITYHTANIIDYLEKAPAASFDRFSLSDIASYMREEDFNRLIHAIHRTARPGARFCIREFISAHAIPCSMKSSFIREPELERQLESKDRCFVYRFMAGSIKK